jgi:hypothetical protein
MRIEFLGLESLTQKGGNWKLKVKSYEFGVLSSEFGVMQFRKEVESC